MSHFEIAVFTTIKNYNKSLNEFGYGFEARDKAVEFLERAFKRSSQHTASVSPADEQIDAPQEEIRSSFEAQVPCTNHIGTWGNLRKWWDYWINDATCKDPHTYGKDCNLLLTAANGGGLGSNNASVVGGSVTAAKANPSADWGYGTKYLKAKNILHEVGHALLNNVENKDDSKLLHDTARVYSHSNGNTITPMGITGDITQHNCVDATYWHTNKNNWPDDGYELRYSDCTEDNFQVK